MHKRDFGSDNHAGIHPNVLKAITAVNDGHVVAYGKDPITAEALQKFKNEFGPDSNTFFVFNGTAANVLGLSAITRSFHAVICSDEAHIEGSECGATENWAGCKLIKVPSHNGKISVDEIRNYIPEIGNDHRVQARVISITQCTESGTVYSLKEIEAVVNYAHQNKMLVHMDGARISNAAVALNVTFREMTTDLGVDLLSFGGTKNGLLAGDAVVFLNPELARDFNHVRMQGLQLASKMRFVAAQFSALLTDRLWFKNAEHSNQMAKLLGSRLEKIKGVTLTRPVETNVVFAILPPKAAEAVRAKFFFHLWNEKTGASRLMTAFDTTEEDVEEFVNLLISELK